MVPVVHPKHQAWLDQVLAFDLADDIVRRELDADGVWHRRGPADFGARRRAGAALPLGERAPAAPDRPAPSDAVRRSFTSRSPVHLCWSPRLLPSPRCSNRPQGEPSREHHQAATRLAGLVSLRSLAAACGSDSSSTDSTAEPQPPAAPTTGGDDHRRDGHGPVRTSSATLNALGRHVPEGLLRRGHRRVHRGQLRCHHQLRRRRLGQGPSGPRRPDRRLGRHRRHHQGRGLPKFKGGDVLYFPTVVAPITVSYNLDGVEKLQLSADDHRQDLPAPRSPPGTTRPSPPTTPT